MTIRKKTFSFLLLAGMFLPLCHQAQGPVNNQPAPSSLEGWQARARQQFQQKDYTGAAASVTECIKLRPSASLYVSRSQAYEAAGKMNEARADLDKAVELRPQADTFRVARGNFLYRQKNFTAALADLRIAITGGTRFPDAWLNRARIYLEWGRYDSALADINYLVAGGAGLKNWQPWAIRAEIYCRKGDKVNAFNDEVIVRKMGGTPAFSCADWGRSHDPGSELFPFKNKEGKWGYADTLGQVRISPKYAAAEDFSEGLALVTVFSGKRYLMGYVDPSGKEKIAPQFVKAFPFSEGLALATLSDSSNARYGFIDGGGQWKIPAQFGYNYHDLRANRFSEGRVALYKDFKMGLVDRAGQTVLPFSYNEVSDFSDGMASILDGDDFFLLNNKLDKIPVLYKYVGAFSEGLAPVCTNYVSGGIHNNGKDGLIDKTGKTVLSPVYDIIAPFREGLALFSERTSKPSAYGSLIGFLDKTGKVAIPAQYDNATDFYEGLALTETPDTKVQFIDKAGKTVIALPKARYNDATHFRNGYALVENRDGSWTLWHRSGKVVKEIR